MRAVLFVLRSINESLDLLFLKTYSGTFADIKTIEDKIKNLRFLRGLVQTQLSIIYNELDYNRREHYTSVLIHLINEFDLTNVVNRTNEKFDLLYDAMQELYLKKNEEKHEKILSGCKFYNCFWNVISDEKKWCQPFQYLYFCYHGYDYCYLYHIYLSWNGFYYFI